MQEVEINIAEGAEMITLGTEDVFYMVLKTTVLSPTKKQFLGSLEKSRHILELKPFNLLTCRWLLSFTILV